MNSAMLTNIMITKTGIKYEQLSTGLHVHFNVLDLDKSYFLTINCYDDLARKVLNMKLKPQEVVIAVGEFELPRLANGQQRVFFRASKIEYVRRGGYVHNEQEHPAEKQEQLPAQSNPVLQVDKRETSQMDEEDCINLDDDDAFLCSSSEL